MPTTSITSTEEHPGPARAAPPRGRPALVCASPIAKALPQPPSGEPVGRKFFAAHGLDDARISGRHFTLGRRGGVLAIEDLGSRNGTFVGGVRIASGERVPLGDGALVRVGRLLLVVRDALVGSDLASPPLGELLGPFGLRPLAHELDALVQRAPRSVLIGGESGTGKDLLARHLAARFGCGDRWAAVNVAGIAAGVFESQLFGYVPGAYSGSGRGSAGILAAHSGGVIFLDEIGELALDLQAKLLRAIENGEIVPVGATKPVRVDVRILTATNRPLEAMVAAGRFRGDLLARFLSAQLEIPPLRERIEDVPTIAAELIRRRGVTMPAEEVEVEALERLMLHAYPFNVRELAAAHDRAIDARAPALRLLELERVLGPATADTHALTRQQVDRALANAGGNETEAARQLGVSRGKLRRFRGT